MKRIVWALLLLPAVLAAQNKFYNYYDNGLAYMASRDWARAITEFRSAVSLEFEDVPRKRTYGTKFIPYFPHRELGIAHYMLGENDVARKELELSLAYRTTERAEEYFSKVTGGVAPPKPEPKKVEVKPAVKPAPVSPAVSSSVSKTELAALPSSILVVTRKYDPAELPQVGSRLSVAVLPFEGNGEAARYRDGVTSEMVNELVNLRRFKVIERSAIDKIISEQKMQASGMVDDKTAVKLGRIAGADALVVGSLSVSGQSLKISARLVDVETGETLIAQDAAAPLNMPESIDPTVANVATMLYNELPIIEGDVIKVDQEELFIDIGSVSGVRKGTKCVVFREGESIKHPISGEILGKRVTRLGEIIVIQVSDKFATVKPVETEQDIKVGDKVIIK